MLAASSRAAAKTVLVAALGAEPASNSLAARKPPKSSAMIQSSLFAEPSRGAPDEGLPVAPSYESVGKSDWYRSYSCGHMSFLDVMATP